MRSQFRQLNKQHKIALSVSLGLVFPAAMTISGARADSPALASPTMAQLLNEASSIGASHSSSAADPMSALRQDPQAPVSLPLTLNLGTNSGLSMLYYAPPALQESASSGPPVANHLQATYGFSDAFALGGGDRTHLKGLFYLGGGQTVNGAQQQSEIISQALDYTAGGWKFQGHYQNVGKDFDGFGTLHGAAGSLGFLAGQTNDTLTALEQAKGKTDFGFNAAFQTKQENFGVSLQDIADSIGHVATQHETLTFGRTVTRGLQLDASHDILDTHAIEGGTAAALNTTTDHVHLGFDQGKGISLFADTHLVSDNQGHSDTQMSYGFDREAHGLSLKANFLNDSNNTGSSNQMLGLNFNWQANKTLALDAASTDKTSANAGTGNDNQRLVHMTWQLRPDFGIEGRLTQESNSTWKQMAAEQMLILHSLVAKRLTVTAQLDQKTDGSTGLAQSSKNLQAKLVVPRFVGMHDAQWMLTMADQIAQGQLASSARSLALDATVHNDQVHLEYSGNATVNGAQRSTLTARALRIVSNQPKHLLQYSLYYKQRAQTLGPKPPDVRDYQASMQLLKMTFLYHYFNQQEQQDGSITDLVQSAYQVSGPLKKTLAWNAQYNQSNNGAGLTGTHGYLLGLKGTLNQKQSLDIAYGRQQLRASTGPVNGDTYKLNYETKTGDDDYLTFDGQLTTWSEKTDQTPAQAVASVDFKVKKVY